MLFAPCMPTLSRREIHNRGYLSAHVVILLEKYDINLVDSRLRFSYLVICVCVFDIDDACRLNQMIEIK